MEYVLDSAPLFLCLSSTFCDFGVNGSDDEEDGKCCRGAVKMAMLVFPVERKVEEFSARALLTLLSTFSGEEVDEGEPRTKPWRPLLVEDQCVADSLAMA